MSGFETAVFIFIVAVLLFVVFAIIRAQRLIHTNALIAEQQLRSIELQERSVRAIERIADALEKGRKE